jgi:hypothetical protein
LSFQRNLKQIQEDLRKIAAGCAVLVGVDQIARRACPDVVGPKSSTLVSFPSVDDYFVLLMEIGEQQSLLLNPATIEDHEFPGFDPGLGTSQAPPPVGEPLEPEPAPVADTDAKCVEKNSKDEPCGFAYPDNLVVGSDGQLRCPFHKHLDPGLTPELEPDPMSQVATDDKLVKLRARNWFGLKLDNSRTEEYLRQLLERMQWDHAVALTVLDWLKTACPFPLASAQDLLEWLLALERNPEVVQRLKELNGAQYTSLSATPVSQDDDPSVEKGRFYGSLFVIDGNLFVLAHDIQRRDQQGRDWPLIGQALRLLGIRTLMELPNFDPEQMQLIQLDYILYKLLKEELTVEDVVTCSDWSALCPPPKPQPQPTSSSVPSNPRSKRGGGRRDSRPRSSASDASTASPSNPPATAQPAPADPVTPNEPEGDPVKEIEEAINRLCKCIVGLPANELLMPDADKTFPDMCVATWGDDSNEDQIREIALEALDTYTQEA